jgi:hypothetical protein
MKTSVIKHPLLACAPVLAALALGFASAGCSGTTDSTSGAGSAGTTTTKDEVVSEAGANDARHQGHGPHGHAGGPDMLVFAALHDDIGLSATQTATVQSLLPSRGGGGGAGHRPGDDPARRAALAAAIRAGKVDDSLLQPPAGTKDDHRAHEAELARSLTTLHDTLSKDQRAALVTAVTAHVSRGPDGGPQGHGPFGPWLDDLGLSQAQKDSLRAKLDADRPDASDRASFEAKHAEHEVAMKAKLETFVSDSFDANAFVAPPADGAAGKPPKRRDDLAVIVSVLDAAQREKLAEKIEQGPPPGPPAP